MFGFFCYQGIWFHNSGHSRDGKVLFAAFLNVVYIDLITQAFASIVTPRYLVYFQHFPTQYPQACKKPEFY